MERYMTWGLLFVDIFQQKFETVYFWKIKGISMRILTAPSTNTESIYVKFDDMQTE